MHFQALNYGANLSKSLLLTALGRKRNSLLLAFIKKRKEEKDFAL